MCGNLSPRCIPYNVVCPGLEAQVLPFLQTDLCQTDSVVGYQMNTLYCLGVQYADTHKFPWPKSPISHETPVVFAHLH